MTIHNAGKNTLLLVIAISIIILSITYYYIDDTIIFYLLLSFCLTIFLFMVSFFRLPKREFSSNETLFLSPADGKVVVIEEIEEKLFLKTKCIQVSIFMSPMNVHCNWFPVSGEVLNQTYSPGKHLFAINPKSSELNERNNVLLKTSKFGNILIRQVAGIMARRIVSFTKTGDIVFQGQQLGFIKLGSRVDIYFPLGTNLCITLGQKVKGRTTIIARANE